jgi:predicted  nucleic acid-binding Zn-ribbon protein
MTATKNEAQLELLECKLSELRCLQVNYEQFRDRHLNDIKLEAGKVQVMSAALSRFVSEENISNLLSCMAAADLRLNHLRNDLKFVNDKLYNIKQQISPVVDEIAKLRTQNSKILVGS